MTISLSRETQDLVEEKLKSGLYRSADDVLRAALEALNDVESQPISMESLDAMSPLRRLPPRRRTPSPPFSPVACPPNARAWWSDP